MSNNSITEIYDILRKHNIKFRLAPNIVIDGEIRINIYINDVSHQIVITYDPMLMRHKNVNRIYIKQKYYEKFIHLIDLEKMIVFLISI